MKKIFLLFFLISSLYSDSTKKIVSGINQFAFNFIKENYSEESLFFSPFCMASDFLLLNNAVLKKDSAKISKFFSIEKLNSDEINKEFNTIINKTKKDIIYANSLWIRDKYKLKDYFYKLAKTYYSTEIIKEDFSSENIIYKMNKWIENKTKGNIKNVFNFKPEEETKAISINSVYFKSEWVKPFNLYKEMYFYPENGSKRKEMMTTTQGDFYFLREKYFEAVRIPYRNEFCIYIFLPYKKKMKYFLEELSIKNWEKWLKKSELSEVKVILPKFKIRNKLFLKDYFKKTDIAFLFDISQANINILEEDPFFIKDYIHLSYINFNEKGTEAAGVSICEYIPMGPGTGIKKEIFIANREFVFFIIHNELKLILFAGVFK